ncbi:MAG: GNAT family N-acetyltransferase [Bacteroidota bacterium]
MTLKIDDHTLLTPISLDYTRVIYENFSSDIIEFLPLPAPPEKIEDTVEFIKLCIDQRQNKTDMVWVILNRNEFSGCCGIHALHSRQPHFGIWIKKQKQ